MTAAETEELVHLVRLVGAGSSPYCTVGSPEFWNGSDNVDYVTCEPCLLQVIQDDGPTGTARAAVIRIGELELKRHHPSIYEDLMRERRRPAEPMDLLAIVQDSRGVQWIRWAYDTHTHNPWLEVGAVHIGTEEDGSDHKSWEDIDVVEVKFPGIPDDERFPQR